MKPIEFLPTLVTRAVASGVSGLVASFGPYFARSFGVTNASMSLVYFSQWMSGLAAVIFLSTLRSSDSEIHPRSRIIAFSLLFALSCWIAAFIPFDLLYLVLVHVCFGFSFFGLVSSVNGYIAVIDPHEMEFWILLVYFGGGAGVMLLVLMGPIATAFGWRYIFGLFAIVLLASSALSVCLPHAKASDSFLRSVSETDPIRTPFDDVLTVDSQSYGIEGMGVGQSASDNIWLALFLQKNVLLSIIMIFVNGYQVTAVMTVLGLWTQQTLKMSLELSSLMYPIYAVGAMFGPPAALWYLKYRSPSYIINYGSCILIAVSIPSSIYVLAAPVFYSLGLASFSLVYFSCFQFVANVVGVSVIVKATNQIETCYLRLFARDPREMAPEFASLFNGVWALGFAGQGLTVPLLWSIPLGYQSVVLSLLASGFLVLGCNMMLPLAR